jgi:Tol biopolymer transport system component
MGTTTRHARAFLLAACFLGSCTDGGTGPTEPAMPSGTLLIGAPSQGTVHVMDAGTGEAREISRFGEPVSRTSSALGPGGMAVTGASIRAGAPSRAIRMVDIPTGDVTTLVEFADAAVASTKLSPDGRALVIGAARWEDPNRISLVMMDVASRQTEIIWMSPDSNRNLGLAELRWLPDASGLIAYLVSIDQGQVVHFDLATRSITPITEMVAPLMIQTLDLSPDGRTIAHTNTRTGDLRFITRTGAPAAGYPTHLRGVLPAFSPDGKLLAWLRYRDGTTEEDGVWYYRFSDGKTWRALPADSPLTWLLDWE